MQYKITNQPETVLVEYIYYVEGKIEINEVPLSFSNWADIEVDGDSPISKELVWNGLTGYGGGARDAITLKLVQNV